MEFKHDRYRLGRLIRQTRARSGYTLPEWAEELGVTHQTAEAWERGRWAPRRERLDMIAAASRWPGLYHDEAIERRKKLQEELAAAYAAYVCTYAHQRQYYIIAEEGA